MFFFEIKFLFLEPFFESFKKLKNVQKSKFSQRKNGKINLQFPPATFSIVFQLNTSEERTKKKQKVKT